MNDAPLTTDALQRAFRARDWTAVDGMNRLQSAGVVSDNAVTLWGVALADIPRAIAWVEDLNNE